jgi:hypothetical protein
MITATRPRSRRPRAAHRPLAIALVAASTLALPERAAANAADPGPSLTFEAGAAWQQRNTARAPNEPPNTRFDIDSITGTGPYATGRLTLDWPIGERHRLRFLYAPLGLEETGTTDETIIFQDATFAPGRIRAEYRFDSYRASYRYVFHDRGDWTWAGGATLNVRDAEIRLTQDGLARSRSDTGFVPLLAVEGEWRFAPRWRGVLDFEGLGAPQGRAIDVALEVAHDVTPNLAVSGAYRLLDGGADNDDVYTFARFDSLLLGLTWRFR